MKLFFKNVIILMKKAWEVEKKYFLCLLFYFFGIGVFTYYTIRSSKIVLDMMQRKELNIQYLVTVALILLVSSIVAAYSKLVFTPIGLKIRYQYLYQISMQYISIPLEEYENPEVQKDFWKIRNTVENPHRGVQGFYTNMALFTGNLAVLLVSLGLLIKIKLWISAIIVVWFIVYTYLSIRASVKIANNFNDNIHVKQEGWYLSDKAIDMDYGKEIRVYRLQNWLQGKLTSNYNEELVLTKKNERTLNVPILLNDVYQFLRDSILYIFLVILYFNGEISIGEFTSYTVLVLQLNQALLSSAVNLDNFLSNHDKLKALFDFVNLPKASNIGIELGEENDMVIEFRNVSFKYPKSETYIYENLNLTIHKKQKLAIVGLNGAGKTTLLKLILRLYKPTSGVITLNGTNIEEYKLDQYFKLFAPVFQEINIFPFTVRDNLSFGADITEKDLVLALENAGILDDRLITDMDNTYMTRILDDDGINLSGGQAQKFATARAFASKRQVYILDEPTSALDALAESEFYHQIKRNMEDKTVLFVSHRLASTQFCDHIILIENGKIIEDGPHSELMNKKGRYAELFELQAKYYQNEVVE